MDDHLVRELGTVLAAWGDADRQGDVDALAELIDADFRGDCPSGFVFGREAWLEHRRAATAAGGRWTWNDVTTQVRHGTGIGTGTLTLPDAQFTATVVASRGPAGWKLVNLQLRRVANDEAVAG